MLPIFASFDLQMRFSKTIQAESKNGINFSFDTGYEATSKSSIVHTTIIALGPGNAPNRVVMPEQGLILMVASRCSAVLEASPITLGLINRATCAWSQFS